MLHALLALARWLYDLAAACGMSVVRLVGLLVPTGLSLLVLGTCGVFIVLYYVKEQHWLFHASEEAERSYWSVIVGVVASAFLFVSGAPLGWFAEAHHLVAVLCVLACIVLVRFLHRYTWGFRFRPFLSLGIGAEDWFAALVQEACAEVESDNAKRMVAEIELVVAELERIRTVFLRAAMRARVLRLETSLLRLLERATPAELNFVVLRINVARTLRIVQNHDSSAAWTAAVVFTGILVFALGVGPLAVFSRQHPLADVLLSLLVGLAGHYIFVRIDRGALHHRAALMELLSCRRVAALNYVGKAIVIDAMHRIGLSSYMGMQRWLVAAFCSASGDELLEIKSILDSSGDYFNLAKLVFDSLTDDAARAELLQHLASEAAALVRAGDGALVGTKVLSDVDDTLTCSGGDGVAGIDARFPKGFLYPGVHALYEVLDACGRSGRLAASPESALHSPLGGARRRSVVAGGNLAFLSARPHVYKSVSESLSYRKFRRLRQAGQLHAMPTLLPGTIAGVRMFWGDFEPIIAAKLANYRRFLALYPEHRFVFIGDNGQGDVFVAADIAAEAGPSASVTGLIHIVQPIDVVPRGRLADPAAWRAHGVVFFDTYIGAALACCERGLIDRQALARVAVAALEDWRAALAAADAADARRRRGARPSISAEVRAAYSAVLQRDAALAGVAV